MKIDTNNGIGFYDECELETDGVATIVDENDCAFGEIYEDGQVVLFPSPDNEN